MNHFNIEGGGPCIATRPEPMKGVIVGDGGSEAEIDNHRYCLSQHLHKAYAGVVAAPFQDQ